VAEALPESAEFMAQPAQIRCCPERRSLRPLALLPQISGSGAVFAAERALSDGKERGMALTLDVLWPLYDGGLASRKRDQAEAAWSRRGLLPQRRGGLYRAGGAGHAQKDSRGRRAGLRLAEQQRDLATAAAASLAHLRGRRG